MDCRTGSLNLPNLLTLGRIACIPLLVSFLFFDGRGSSFGAALIFSLAAITDWLDGYLARKWQVVTVLGKFLDPLADKLIVMAALIMLIPLGRVPAWAVFVILAREIIITGLRSIAATEGIVIAASNLGKYKTILQMVAIIGLLLHYDYYWFFGMRYEWLHVSMHRIGLVYFYLALALTLWSGIDYLVKFFRVINR
ncbi:CDP-diacylglycerol--glycerol-3-phosphate 3-phosphatidyltransferase [Syntrophotalea acetylenivorans]|uniref:CDP-diacylglycerol--glycerol-3-phosphate 3-phosphatidyltransferase n=1 Tax=Syntrophotalea acetylenivorans TaxID=1842532 RepID=A0A1L3GLR3_9BACT|nr:CDP-diacylglycerol--glycerol-3-phosphate 3-phosphatidyltransferase [Syntrophotalea acetylenivorans]APG26840.1 CDP-diacylglycerol--glycerol-3-phosphate 3-phosphatidyltransferase [Syntrophotalea acetylenivorans]